MRTSIKQAVTLLSVLLAGCGADGTMGTSQPATPPVQLATMAGSSAQVADPGLYTSVVQHLYLAYFGRPADPSGLDFYVHKYAGAASPSDVRGLADAYYTNPTVQALVESFSNSDESRGLYTGDNDAFLTAVYRNLFNRAPDPEGLAFWRGKLDIGAMTRANAALNIMAGAQPPDMAMIDQKAAVAVNFTAAINTQARVNAYQGPGPLATVRAMLATVTANTDLAAFNATIEDTLNQLVATTQPPPPPPPPPPPDPYAPVAQIIAARCVGCHSANPTIPGFTPAPLGIMFDTSAQVHARSAQIASVVGSGFMPYGNMTGMTAAERKVIADWFAAGAP